MTPQDLALAAPSALFIQFDPTAAERLLAPDYIQHNPNVPTGAAPVLAFIPALEESVIEITTHRVIAEGDIVVTHNSYENAQAFGAEKIVTFDVFRVEDGKIAEHWDNIQPWRAETASGRSMVDGRAEISDRDKTEANKAVVQNLLRDVLMGENPAAIDDYIRGGPDGYHQHNPDIPDGLDGVKGAFAALQAEGLSFVYDEVHMVVAEGNFVFSMSEGRFGETPTAFFDLFRLEDGMIVEHWDVIEAIPAEMAHDNGKF